MRILPVLAILACKAKDDTEFVDEDGDGFTTQYDCDDADPAIFPTADEVWTTTATGRPMSPPRSTR
jgi:hypothetical protein